MLGGVRWCPTEQKGLALVNQAGPLNCIELNHAACSSCCRPMRSHRCRKASVCCCAQTLHWWCGGQQKPGHSGFWPPGLDCAAIGGDADLGLEGQHFGCGDGSEGIEK